MPEAMVSRHRDNDGRCPVFVRTLASRFLHDTRLRLAIPTAPAASRKASKLIHRTGTIRNLAGRWGSKIAGSSLLARFVA